MRKALIFLTAFFILSCASQQHIQEYLFAADTVMYFFPPSEWAGEGLTADVDFNFKSRADIEAICNISIMREEKMPGGISSITLNADGAGYPLQNMKIMLVNSQVNTVRITSVLSHDNFLKIMGSKDILLEIDMDGWKYRCIPENDFNMLKEEFQNNYLKIGEILK